MNYIYHGKKNEEIAQEMSIQLSTVKFHVGNIYKKLQVKNRQAAIRKAEQLGWYRWKDIVYSKKIQKIQKPYLGIVEKENKMWYTYERWRNKLHKRRNSCYKKSKGDGNSCRKSAVIFFARMHELCFQMDKKVVKYL